MYKNKIQIKTVLFRFKLGSVSFPSTIILKQKIKITTVLSECTNDTQFTQKYITDVSFHIRYFSFQFTCLCEIHNTRVKVLPHSRTGLALECSDMAGYFKSTKAVSSKQSLFLFLLERTR